MNGFIKAYRYFFERYPGRSVMVLALLILAGLAEAFGIMWFLPFLQVSLEGGLQNNIDIAPLRIFLDVTGLEPTFLTFGVLIVFALGAKAVILWLSMRYVSATVSKIAYDLRARLMQSLLRAQWNYFTGYTLGASLNALIKETYRSSTVFIAAARFLAGFIQFIIYAVSAALVSLMVFSGGIVIGLTLVFILWNLVAISKRAGRLQTVKEKSILTHMADMLQGIKPLRAMALEQKFKTALDDDSKKLETAQFQQLLASQSMSIFHEPLMVVAAIGGLYLIVTYTDLPASEIALMGILFFRMLTSMNIVQNQYQKVMVEESALSSLLEGIEETENREEHWPGTKPPPDSIETIRFENVHFSHGEMNVLRDVSLTLHPGSLSALIGPSGSGKTTAMDMICGFYRPDQGHILINGTDINAVNLSAWRGRIGFIPQEVFLFNSTIRDNILVGRSGLTDDDIWAALKQAGANDFVRAMDGGLDAPVGENGRKLSGGQRQRIAIARAIVHRPDILLLDEPTSALDKDTEQRLFETLKNLAGSMMILCISHNHAIQKYADHIYEIENGQILHHQKKS